IMIPILVYIGIKFMARSPVTLRTMLSRESGVTSQPEALSDYLGCMGRAATDLRPSGVAVIDKTRVDVVTRGEYIQKNTQIEVIAVRGNAIIVRTKEANA
ncbi:MAG: serine protease, partial [Desulfatitalea sp.]|nr:NfeD family protein [Desulfatitalea sp.]NNJ99766.1 serine protease [Desulfatitalea sp.]